MGIDITCGNNSTGMSYSGWMWFRESVIKIAIMRVKKEIDKIKESNQKEQGRCYYFMGNMEIISNKLFNMIEKTKKQESAEHDYMRLLIEDTLFRTFLSLIETNRDYLDALIEFGMGGLYALCAKSDCQGYYSSGNALDICNLFDLIKDDVKEYNKELYECIYNSGKNESWDSSIYGVFKESWTNNITVIIS